MDRTMHLALGCLSDEFCPDLLGPRPDWLGWAACRGMPAEFFFPAGTEGDLARRSVAAAKHVCSRCPVREPCLEYAVDTRQRDGIWGGTTERERSTRAPLERP